MPRQELGKPSTELYAPFRREMRLHIKKIAAFMVVVFAMFICGNTFFIHTHYSDDGRKITHSHPYLPGQSHHHTANALQCIANANATAQSMLSSRIQTIDCAEYLCLGTIRPVTAATAGVSYDDLSRRRAPPAC